ncbi:MAG: tyrosine-type recombinase/integrase [Gammaproteobacteria bacterium]|nr:tyrosine-type recombinase/integrase [Gammaproteobacteria bacterium]
MGTRTTRKTKVAGVMFETETKKYIIDKTVDGHRLYERTKYGKGEFAKVEKRLAFLIEELRKSTFDRNKDNDFVFRQAALKYLVENQSNRTIKGDEGQLRRLDVHIGHIPIRLLHPGTKELKNFIDDLRDNGRKTKTLNSYLEIVRRILNLAHLEWRDDNNLPWLTHPVRIKLFEIKDARPPWPIDWKEQNSLLPHLAPHLRAMCITTLNTGFRDNEVCNLRWEWEVEVENGLAFIIPEFIVKGQTVGERLVICNAIATQVINERRGTHADYVFTYKGFPIKRMTNSGWKCARAKAGLHGLHFHDMRHTFGHRLRAAEVDKQTRSELMGHANDGMQDHYSAADINYLYEQANKICVPIKTKTFIQLKRRMR